MIDVLFLPAVSGQRSNESRSLVADDAAAFRFVAIMYGPLDIAVQRLLGSNPELTAALTAAYAPLMTRFEPGAQYRLVPFTDPEATTSAKPGLVVQISTGLPVTDVLAALADFDTSWYLDQSLNITSQIAFIPEFV